MDSEREAQASDASVEKIWRRRAVQALRPPMAISGADNSHIGIATA